MPRTRRADRARYIVAVSVMVVTVPAVVGTWNADPAKEMEWGTPPVVPKPGPSVQFTETDATSLAAATHRQWEHAR